MILDQIMTWLSDEGVPFRHLHHEPTRTSEDAARVRGEPLEIGAKAIVLKIDDRFALFVLSAARKLDSKAIRNRLTAKKTRFATPEELMSLTGLVPGSVPPFGRPILDLDLYLDPAILDHERVAFNAGSLTDSIIIPSREYRRLANPNVFLFSS